MMRQDKIVFAGNRLLGNLHGQIECDKHTTDFRSFRSDQKTDPIAFPRKRFRRNLFHHVAELAYRHISSPNFL